MIEPYRGDFNARFTEARYAELLRVLDEQVGTHVEFGWRRRLASLRPS